MYKTGDLIASIPVENQYILLIGKRLLIRHAFKSRTTVITLLAKFEWTS